MSRLRDELKNSASSQLSFSDDFGLLPTIEADAEKEKNKSFLEKLVSWTRKRVFVNKIEDVVKKPKSIYTIHNIGEVISRSHGFAQSRFKDRIRFVLLADSSPDINHFRFATEGIPTAKNDIPSHGIMTEGRQVFSAGTMTFNDKRQMCKIDHMSGHVRPTFESLKPVFYLLANYRPELLADKIIVHCLDKSGGVENIFEVEKAELCKLQLPISPLSSPVVSAQQTRSERDQSFSPACALENSQPKSAILKTTPVKPTKRRSFRSHSQSTPDFSATYDLLPTNPKVTTPSQASVQSPAFNSTTKLSSPWLSPDIFSMSKQGTPTKVRTRSSVRLTAPSFYEEIEAVVASSELQTPTQKSFADPSSPLLSAMAFVAHQMRAIPDSQQAMKPLTQTGCTTPIKCLSFVAGE